MSITKEDLQEITHTTPAPPKATYEIVNALIEREFPEPRPAWKPRAGTLAFPDDDYICNGMCIFDGQDWVRTDTGNKIRDTQPHPTRGATYKELRADVESQHGMTVQSLERLAHLAYLPKPLDEATRELLKEAIRYVRYYSESGMKPNPPPPADELVAKLDAAIGETG